MNINFPIDAHSEKTMVPQYDKAYVCLSGGIKALDEDDIENVHLRWLHLCIMYIIEYSPVQTGNVWRSNSLQHELFYVDDTFSRLENLFDGV